MDKNELAFDIDISSSVSGKNKFYLEVTENYEGDKWHVAIYEKENGVHEYYETKGFETMDEFINYLRQLTEE
tara:strand:- start:797 stop:1012 length:216 start_codon:yes stop_codon:yes gene_type:complete